MKILIFLTILLNLSTFAQCNIDKSIALIGDYIHENDEFSNMISGDIDYSLHLKIRENLDVVKNEVQHTYSYGQKILSTQDGLTCQELIITLDCTLEKNQTIPTHKYFNCKN